jgi:hypothetical protein
MAGNSLTLVDPRVQRPGGRAAVTGAEFADLLRERLAGRPGRVSELAIHGSRLISHWAIGCCTGLRIRGRMLQENAVTCNALICSVLAFSPVASICTKMQQN